MNQNEAYVFHHGYEKCPHCDMYVHQIKSEAYNEGRKDALTSLREKMPKEKEPMKFVALPHRHNEEIFKKVGFNDCLSQINTLIEDSIKLPQGEEGEV